MSVLDWLFIGLLSTAILCLLFVVVFFIQSLVDGGRRKKLQKKRIKNKRKRKKLKREIQRLRRKQTAGLRNALLLLVLGGALGGGAFYSRYYQSHTLGEKDTDAIVQGYYLIDTIEQALNAEDALDNPGKTANTIRDLTGRLSSYGTRVANRRLTTEGQSLLNRQYGYMKELGVNLYAKVDQYLESPEQLAIVQQDIEKIKTQQKKVFEHFKINESSLQKTN